MFSVLKSAAAHLETVHVAKKTLCAAEIKSKHSFSIIRRSQIRWHHGDNIQEIHQSEQLITSL